MEALIIKLYKKETISISGAAPLRTSKAPLTFLATYFHNYMAHIKIPP
jgi:hypothetical protein